MIRKRRKTTPIVKLQREAEELWKKVCRLRDMNTCQVKVNFPEISIPHNDIIQVDHCFSRMDKNLFLDVRNGTTVCSTCNGLKNWDKRSVGRLIDRIVIKREGKKVFEEMMKINKSGKPNENWTNPLWLEGEIKKLYDMSVKLTLKISEINMTPNY